LTYTCHNASLAIRIPDFVSLDAKLRCGITAIQADLAVWKLASRTGDATTGGNGKSAPVRLGGKGTIEQTLSYQGSGRSPSEEHFGNGVVQYLPRKEMQCSRK
jgi:hypothetical protein